VKRILILSDTHSYSDEHVLRFVEEADEVWHAGDWGNVLLSDQIEERKPIQAVYGNVDGQDIRVRYPKVNSFEREGVRILMTHIAGYPGKYNKEARSLIAKYKPNIFICGHSHILKVERVKSTGMIHINPGAAGNHGFHKMRTMIRLKIENGRVFDLEVIELGKRGLIE
jgi:putative phosphoesterase